MTKPKTETTTAPITRVCLFPGCCNTRRTRGQCHTHYQQTQAMLRSGDADDADLVRRGLRTKPGAKDGGSEVAPGAREIFRKGSKVKGDLKA